MLCDVYGIQKMFHNNNEGAPLALEWDAFVCNCYNTSSRKTKAEKALSFQPFG